MFHPILGTKNVCHLHWKQRGHKGAIQVHLTIHSHFLTTWVVLEGNMLCEIRQRDNDKIMISSLYLESKKLKQQINKIK